MTRVGLMVMAAVLMPAQLLAAQRPLDLTGKPDAIIDEPFTLVSGVRELPGNRAIVTDQMDHRVLLVDFGTNSVAQVGRQGAGPGEYRFPMAPLAGPANTTWIVDAALRRTLVIDAAGRITTSHGTPTAGVPGGLQTVRGTDERGRIYFEGSGFDPDGGRFADTVPVVRWDPATNRTDLLARVSNGGRLGLRRADGLTSLARSITPFPHMDAWGVLPDGHVVIVHHAPFRIDVVMEAGAVGRGKSIPYTPIAVSAGERNAWREQRSFQRSGAMMKDGSTGPAQPGPQFRDEDFPETMPPFIASAVLTTPDAQVWIGRSHLASDRTWRYDIFDAGGAPIGSATLRANSTVVGFGAGTVYVARKDPSDDLVYLERYRR
jgi:hypothetical protein